MWNCVSMCNYPGEPHVTCTIGEINFCANIKLSQLYDWLTANKLSVNIEKTSYMTFPRDKDNETLLCID